MLKTVKKVFFTGMFGVLYASFLAQVVYVLGFVNGIDKKFIALAMLSLEWMIIITARYLSKKSGNGGYRNNNNNNYNNRRRN